MKSAQRLGVLPGSRFRWGLSSCLAVLAGMALVSGALLLSGCAEKDDSVLNTDTTPPRVVALAEAEGRISWQTSEDAFCVLLYGSRRGLYDHYGYNAQDGGQAHFVDLIDVGPGKYYVRVVARDLAGNSSTTAETTFTVAEVPAVEALEYTMIDVGWGDCHFLEFPNGTTVMIDAGYGGQYGGADHSGDIYAFLQARQITAPGGIDYMIATHAHLDHYGGFEKVIGLYRETVFMAPEAASVSVWPYVRAALDQTGVPRIGLSEGQSSASSTSLDWDPEHGVEVMVLSSGAGRFFRAGQEGDSINCDSIVLKISYGEVDILLTGDGEEFVEQRMIKAYGDDLDCEVLKVGHHANDDATSKPFLRATSPRVGLISNSMAENDGVFDQSVVNLLRGFSVDYFVTDRAYMNAGRYDSPEHGNITVTTDGETFTVGSWRP